MPFSGNLTRSGDFSRNFDGDLTATGAIGSSNFLYQSVSGEHSFTGEVTTRDANNRVSLSGVLSMVGAVTTRLPFTRLLLTGILTMFGVIGDSTLYQVGLSGVMDFTKNLYFRSPFRRLSLSGTLALFGVLTKTGGQVVAGLFRALFKGDLFNGGIFRR